MKRDKTMEFTDTEINHFKSATEPGRARLFSVMFLVAAAIFASTSVMAFVSSYHYLRMAGIDFTSFLTLNMTPERNYQGALCLARDCTRNSIGSLVLSVTMVVLIIVRRRQIHWMRKTLHLMETNAANHSSEDAGEK